MAGKGPAPKPNEMRQRRNKKASAAKLTVLPDSGDPPELPNPDEREWHDLTLAWWKHVWNSPMASEYLQTDLDGLARLAVLVDRFNKSPSVNTMKEIRLQEARFGLSPVDRNRLHWEVQKGEEAKQKREESESGGDEDPRDALGAAN